MNIPGDVDVIGRCGDDNKFKPVGLRPPFSVIPGFPPLFFPNSGMVGGGGCLSAM